MFMSNDDVRRFLPHTEPFLFVDTIKELTPSPEKNELKNKQVWTAKEMEGANIVGSFQVRKDLEILRGHFPGNPILPGVVQLEMMAQVACCTLFKALEKPFEAQLDVALVGSSYAKYRRPVIPGMELDIRVKCARYRANMWSYEGQIFNNNEVVSEANFMAAFKL